ncbi:hypothetical protein QQY66_01170 [Streptomyces sp. DG2A-72]|uniref:hypothetical protein n=1 Tax=Streptomyces sp. DG2A-72 TaxID=3051386 RepID=UPI00265C8517|nr:hypothetical protein [Streptomyces sp. DG2A-72]MDO0930375.1 hypothetical protein [Streptomyces sp. DG2A-72]
MGRGSRRPALEAEPVETPDQLVDEGELITVKVAEVDLQRHLRGQAVASGHLDAYLAYMLITLVAVLALVTALA